MPTDDWRLVLEFASGEFRLFKVTDAGMAKPSRNLCDPSYVKRVRYADSGVRWSKDEALSAEYLYEHSVPLSAEQLRWQSLEVSRMNRAPTPQDEKHHVYAVDLRPHSEEQIVLSESIHGGHADRGGSNYHSFKELVGLPHWEQHFTLSGCEWAVALIRQPLDARRISRELIAEVCARARRAPRPRRLFVVGPNRLRRTGRNKRVEPDPS